MPRVWDVVPSGQCSPFRPEALEGRVALITGGASGIGLEIAREFGKHGAKVCIMGRRQAFLDGALERLRFEGVTAAAVSADVRNPADCARAVRTAVELLGGLDILVNSAAGNFLAPAEALSPNGFKTVMDIDAQGVFNMCHASFAPLRDSRFGGNIINISFTLHFGATWYQTHACAAKAAIDSMTRSLALEWGDYGIRVNGIAPGPIADTPGLAKLLPSKQDAAAKRRMLEHTARQQPLCRLGTKYDIAMAAIFLCSAGGGNVTGHTVISDGGNWVALRAPPLPREAVLKAARKIEKVSRAKM
eukprot:TRINITY_DN2022_c0_g1_i1.p3 TRINITY_DN2022_c0_g1~~TRINITY_DN2022_c0_g1_i1.p3  ORF type:complete len:331 (+),score=140.57 TRINITY_DN2022_c0_g1_i1:85-993(+)